MGAFTSAYTYGADFLELDVQITADNHLVVNHDPTLSPTFNVEEFESLFGSRRKTVKLANGKVYNDDYLIRDFTLAEIKMLRRK
mmetsp:Transcript_7913/g.7419  ORF Transcript_7913/g.7419 Transcript_7913/m.7419 type:complete len:84 (-) Transcript_7913:282-533(-)